MPALQRKQPCPFCGDHGEVIVPIARDEFGNWETDSRPCSCPAGDAMAVRLAAARAWHAARNESSSSQGPLDSTDPRPAVWRAGRGG
jgi:hypothetical protein